MPPLSLTPNQRKTLFGLITYPQLSDKALAAQLEMSESSLSAAKSRLQELTLFKSVNIPMMNRFGYELLGINFTNFILGLSVEDRIAMTLQSFEQNKEIFLSVGDNEKGFSLNFCQNYTQYIKINLERTQVFGKLQILGRGHPQGIVFPFETSTIFKFFDFSYQVYDLLNIEECGFKLPPLEISNFFSAGPLEKLTPKESQVFQCLLDCPDLNNQEIAKKLAIHRHTISSVRHKIEDSVLMKKLIIPDLKLLGFELLVFYNLRYNADRPPTTEELVKIMDKFSIFFAHNIFESVMICIYANFNEYLNHRSFLTKFLEKRHILSDEKEIYEYSIPNMTVIKNFEFREIF